MKNTAPVLFLATAGAAVAVLSACSSSGGSAASSSSSDTASAGATAPAPAGQHVTAELSEFKIALNRSTVQAGTYTFEVKNTGHITHALTVTGPGVSAKSTGDLSPGSSKALTVTLKAGKYDVFCPVGNHKMQGMDDTMTVS